MENNRLKAEYGDLFDSVADILFQPDPVGINFEDNTDEYYPEVRTILPRLKDCHSAQDVTSVVHEEFVRWFEPETAGPKDYLPTSLGRNLETLAGSCGESSQITDEGPR